MSSRHNRFLRARLSSVRGLVELCRFVKVFDPVYPRWLDRSEAKVPRPLSERGTPATFVSRTIVVREGVDFIFLPYPTLSVYRHRRPLPSTTRGTHSARSRLGKLRVSYFPAVPSYRRPFVAFLRARNQRVEADKRIVHDIRSIVAQRAIPVMRRKVRA